MSKTMKIVVVWKTVVKMVRPIGIKWPIADVLKLSFHSTLLPTAIVETFKRRYVVVCVCVCVCVEKWIDCCG